jgi:hypothetical protein
MRGFARTRTRNDTCRSPRVHEMRSKVSRALWLRVHPRFTRSVTALRALRIAVLAPLAWRTPPRHHGPWEQFASLLTEGLARGHDVTLFATADAVT